MTPVRGTHAVHDAASSCTGLVRGICASRPSCARTLGASGLFCRNAMSRAGGNRVVFSLLSYREATRRPIGQGQSELPGTTAEKRGRHCVFARRVSSPKRGGRRSCRLCCSRRRSPTKEGRRGPPGLFLGRAQGGGPVQSLERLAMTSSWRRACCESIHESITKLVPHPLTPGPGIFVLWVFGWVHG
jgi:hypothetical protein